MFFMGRSVIADYIIRRTFMVGMQIQTYYFDAIFYSHVFLDNLLFGLDLQDEKSPTFFIGETYFLNPETNANTNAFLYALAKTGCLGLLCCIAFICIFLCALDKKYAKIQSINMIAIASLYTVLILEQAYTTALISSGILLLFCLVSISSSKSPRRLEVVTKG